MYIGPWQEYKIANAFTQPSIERHAQLTEFYARWQRLCQEQGEQAATKALIFDPLFASVQQQPVPPPQQQYHLEPQSAPVGFKRSWRLDAGAAGSGAVGADPRSRRSAAVHSAGAAVAGSKSRRPHPKRSVRNVERRKANYLQSLRQIDGSSRSASVEAPGGGGSSGSVDGGAVVIPSPGLCSRPASRVEQENVAPACGQ